MLDTNTNKNTNTDGPEGATAHSTGGQSSGTIVEIKQQQNIGELSRAQWWRLIHNETTDHGYSWGGMSLFMGLYALIIKGVIKIEPYGGAANNASAQFAVAGSATLGTLNLVRIISALRHSEGWSDGLRKGCQGVLLGPLFFTVFLGTQVLLNNLDPDAAQDIANLIFDHADSDNDVTATAIVSGGAALLFLVAVQTSRVTQTRHVLKHVVFNLLGSGLPYVASLLAKYVLDNSLADDAANEWGGWIKLFIVNGVSILTFSPRQIALFWPGSEKKANSILRTTVGKEGYYRGVNATDEEAALLLEGANGALPKRGCMACLARAWGLFRYYVAGVEKVETESTTVTTQGYRSSETS